MFSGFPYGGLSAKALTGICSRSSCQSLWMLDVCIGLSMSMSCCPYAVFYGA